MPTQVRIAGMRGECLELSSIVVLVRTRETGAFSVLATARHNYAPPGCRTMPVQVLARLVLDKFPV